MFQKNLASLIEIQQQAVSFIKQYKKFFLNWETGIGKTLPALQAAHDIGGKWLWVMSQNVQEKNILAECKKFKLKPDIVFVNYISLHKYCSATGFKGIILDECHRLTMKSASCLPEIPVEYCICLSASITPQRRVVLKEATGYVKAWKITLTEGMKLGIIPPMGIVGVEVPLDLDTDIYTAEMKRFTSSKPVHMNFDEYIFNSKRYIADDFIVRACTLKEYLQVIENEMEFWKQQYYSKKQEWLKDTRWLPLGGLRKRILADHKARSLDIIQEHLKGKRYVIFAESIEQLKKLQGEKIHSKLPKEDVEKAIKKFNTGKTNVLCTVRMLNEGINLSNIDAVVILSLNGIDVQNIQRRGRSTRGTNPVVYACYVPFTKDHQNFTKFVEGYEDKTRIITIDKLKTHMYEEFTDK
jgi:superfamily II DNA or RNA helicase